MFVDLTKYIGIPYADKGRDPATGLDCWGLLRYFYEREMGVLLPSYTEAASGGTDRQGVAAVVRAEALRAWKQVDTPQIGDAIVVTLSGRPFHIGVHVGRSQMLHTLDEHGSVIEPLRSPKWAARTEGFFRHV